MVAVATLFEWWSVPPYLFNPGLDVAVQNYSIAGGKRDDSS